MTAPSLYEQAQAVGRVARRDLIARLVPRPRPSEEDRMIEAMEAAAKTLRDLAVSKENEGKGK